MKLFQKIRNLTQPRLYWKNIFNYYRNQNPFQKSVVQITDLNKEKSVLVLCPHIDDDVIGLGGTLCRYRELGIPVNVIYFTTGNERRKEEGNKIAAFLGYREVSFFDFLPEQLSRHHEIPDIIASHLTKNHFDLIYAPFYLDRHKDHIALSLHLAAALQKLPDMKLEIRSYEVWAPLFPNQIVDISTVFERKKEAIMICQSQMETVDYVDLALSLNRYRGITSTREKQMQYGEAFYSSTSSSYLRDFGVRN
ncbi:MAG: PIG-L family deacetylase [Nitrospirae bacterium]|nr:PIG-L family deacetylase [Nitrospirota bacterium]MBI3593558.1 PIG-L family deacetylase [Nitrospirota bacterium]